MKKNMDKEFLIQEQPICRICRYRLKDICGECLADGQYPWFHAKDNLTLDDLPSFPLKEFNNGMPNKERQILVGIYMDMIVRKLQEG